LVKTYDQMVVKEVRSCLGCPDIRELTLWDGSRWYVRYRWGVARLARDDRDDPHAVSIQVGDALDGIFADRDEFERTFMALASQHPGMEPLLTSPWPG
jgi:hypothetical protein